MKAVDKYYNRTITEDYNNRIERLKKHFPENIKIDNTHMLRNITIQVTEACNLCCKYCYQINKSPARLNFETAKKFIDIVLEPDQPKNKYFDSWEGSFVILDFIGGEPLLEINLIDKICDYFVKRLIELDHPWKVGYMISIGTNGVLYFDERVQQFIEKHKDKTSFAITLDGDKELHDSCRIFPDGSGSYDMAVAACKAELDKKVGVPMGSKLTMAPENIMYIKDAIVHMIDLGYVNINENCVYEEGWKQEHATILYHQLKDLADYLLDNDLEDKITIRVFNPDDYMPMDPMDDQNWCGGDGSMLALDVDGNIFNCVRYMKSSLGDDQVPLRIGDVENGIGMLANDCKNIGCMRCVTRSSQSTKECFECPIAQGCGWCSAYNYQKFGTVNKRAIFICEMHKAQSLANTYFWNKVLIKHDETERLQMYCPEEWAVPIIGQEEYDMLKKLSEE